MTTAHITANDTQLKLLIEFCKANGIGLDIPEPPTPLKADTAFRTPSASLKHFCGSEMMTSRGKMQPSAALEFIMNYAKNHRLIDSTMIILDENLREIFNGHASISYTELPVLVNALFSD